MAVATEMPDDRRESVQRLVLVLAHVRREMRRADKAARRARSKAENADAKLDSEIAIAMTRFRYDAQAALARWAEAKGISG